MLDKLTRCTTKLCTPLQTPMYPKREYLTLVLVFSGYLSVLQPPTGYMLSPVDWLSLTIHSPPKPWVSSQKSIPSHETHYSATAPKSERSVKLLTGTLSKLEHGELTL